MKKLMLKIVPMFIVSALVFTSCENNDSEAIVTEADAFTEDETIALVESDDISDEIDNLFESYMDYDLSAKSETEASKNNGKGKKLPECATETVVEDGDNKTVTIDFGESCETHHGHILAGKIIISYVLDASSNVLTISKTYDGFTFNDVAVEGSKTIVRTEENADGFAQSEKTISITYTWTDGEVATVSGTRTSVWIEGFDTETWGDNVYEITGSKSMTLKDGTVINSTIVEPLIRDMACRFIISGIVEIEKDDVTGTLDFGDGSCDNVAIFTDETGEETEITLRKRKKKGGK